MKSCSFVGTRGRKDHAKSEVVRTNPVGCCLPAAMHAGQARATFGVHVRPPRPLACRRLALALQLSSQFRNQHLRYLATTCQPQPAPATVHTQLSRFACSWGFRSSEHTRIKRCRDWVINEFLSGIFLFFVHSCSRMVSSAMSQSTETVHC